MKLLLMMLVTGIFFVGGFIQGKKSVKLYIDDLEKGTRSVMDCKGLVTESEMVSDNTVRIKSRGALIKVYTQGIGERPGTNIEINCY